MTADKDGETKALVDSGADLIEINDTLVLRQTRTMYQKELNFFLLTYHSCKGS